MQTSSNGTALIQSFESCLKPIGDGRFRTYRCPANVVTIGWGTTASDVPDLREGDVWDQAKCDRVFAASLGKYENAVSRLAAKRPSPLDQNEFDALVSFAYNCGTGALNSSVGRAVIEGRDADVPACLDKWCRGAGRVLPGLVRRRKAEGQLYAGDYAAASKTAQTILRGSMAQNHDQNRVTTPAERKAGTGAVVAVTTTAAAAKSAGYDWTTIGAAAALVVLFCVIAAIAYKATRK